MIAAPVVAAGSLGLLCALVTARLHPPRRRLAVRVRPYTIGARIALGRRADVLPGAGVFAGAPGLVPGWFTKGVGRAARLVERSSDEQLALRLRQAGIAVGVDEHRLRVLLGGVVGGALGALGGVVVLRSGVLALALMAGGALGGASRVRARVDHTIEHRRERMRLELYTVNQLLALHARTGAGPVQAMQRLVDRGRGAVVEEIVEVLARIRNGVPESEALRRAAELTPEPAVARTFRLVATGVERGADLGTALRALSEDIRDARREEVRKIATRRRAAMLLPTIAVLAPVMLLFVAAPLPTIVFGNR